MTPVPYAAQRQAIDAAAHRLSRRPRRGKARSRSPVDQEQLAGLEEALVTAARLADIASVVGDATLDTAIARFSSQARSTPGERS